jgi:hypothetical protein
MSEVFIHATSTTPRPVTSGRRTDPSVTSV